MARSIGIIGVGNPLRRDDGIGILLLNYLKESNEIFPAHVTFVDGGTGGVNLLHLFSRFDVVFLLDAVDFKGKTGQTRFFSFKDIISQKKVSTVSTHNVDVFQIITFGQQIDEFPKEIFVFGVQPQDVSFGQGLSDSIKKRFDIIADSMKQHILEAIKKMNQ